MSVTVYQGSLAGKVGETSATTSLQVKSLPPVIVLSHPGTQWVVPANKTFTLDGMGRPGALVCRVHSR